MFKKYSDWNSSLGLLTIAMMTLGLFVAPAFAAYQDPVVLAAIKMASSQKSLLLDVTQAGQRLVVVGERGHILYSDDQGESWTQADVNTRLHLNSVTFIDANNGWVVGEDLVILHTKDGGKSWLRQYDGREFGQKGPLLDIHFNNDREGFAVGVFNNLLRTNDGGQSWIPWQDHIDNLDEWHLFSIAATSKSNLYIASEIGLIFRSLDGGKNFEAVQTDHDGSFHGILARQGSDGHDQLILFGVGGVLYTSTDGGDHWDLVDTGIDTGLSGGAWLDDGSALIVGADGMVLQLSKDLQVVSQQGIENGLPLSAVVSTENQGLVLVGLGGIQSMNIEQLQRQR
jgi:photosystem II stability/assembly factor-like uncharacterized protein